jgi:hypothetical protein
VPELKDNQILLKTDDAELWNDLFNAKIEGIEVTGIKRYDGSAIQDLIITFGPFAATMLTLIAERIWKHLTKNPTKKTTINEKPVPNEVNNIVVFLKQETTIHNYAPNQEKDHTTAPVRNFSFIGQSVKPATARRNAFPK